MTLQFKIIVTDTYLRLGSFLILIVGTRDHLYHKIMLKRIFLVFLSVAAFQLQVRAQSESASDPMGDVKVTSYGNIALITNYIEHGLTQTQKTPAMQGNFMFQFGPQLKLGFGGTSVHFEDGDEYLNLRVIAGIVIPIGKNAMIDATMTTNKYYNGVDRNGSVTRFEIILSGYRFISESYSNWEGTKKKASFMGFGKRFDLQNNAFWTLLFDYGTPKAEGYKSYFSTKLTIGTTKNKISYEAGISAVTNASQFSSQAGAFPFASASTQF